jgi:pimeloyl-ACP methyl ester carboxylesterase
LLLVHGLGDEADSWRHVLLPLAERYHVVAPDLPGFGRSESLPLPGRTRGIYPQMTQMYADGFLSLVALRRPSLHSLLSLNSSFCFPLFDSSAYICAICG